MSDRVLRTIGWTGLLVATVVTASTVVMTVSGADAATTGSRASDAGWALAILAFSAVGALVIGRQPRLSVGWIFSAIGLLYGLDQLGLRYWINASAALAGSVDVWFVWAVGWFWAPPITLAVTLLPLTFPDGRLPSPGWRPAVWLAVLAIVATTLGAALTPLLLGDPYVLHRQPATLHPVRVPGILLFVAAVASSFAAVAVRIRRGTAVERQQLTLFVYGVAVFALGIIVPLTAFGIDHDLGIVLSEVMVPFTFAAIPVAAGLAIFRYRLYDIDLLINRTIVYGAVSVALIVMYFLAVVLLQALLRPFTSGSELAVAGSTLLVVALFQPLRRRVQDAVDRRFYRSRYDAARTLDAFGARLRDEVDLDDVSADLLNVVRDTVRPAHASMWLRR